MLTARFYRVFGMIWYSVDDKKLRPSDRNITDGLNAKKTARSSLLTKRQLAFEQVAEFVVEFVHTTGSVDDFLSTGVERVAQRANLNVEAVFFHCGFGYEFVAARAGNVDFVVVRVNTLFHLISFRLSGHRGFACTSVKRGIFAIFGCFVKRIFCVAGSFATGENSLE